MAGKKTTTVTNIVRTNATDTKKFMRLCGQPVAEADKLHVMQYEVYGIDFDGNLVNIGAPYTRFALIPYSVTVEQAASTYTAADAREFELLQRMIAGGIASDEDKRRYDVLSAKADGMTTKAQYNADDVSGHNIGEWDEVGKLLTTLTLS